MEIELREGFWWPISDKIAFQSAKGTVDDLALAVKLCRGHSACVQAGGNCGVWPARLAATFQTVWTFEPDPENYLCLIRNVPENVRPVFAALGHKETLVDLIREPGNTGAHRVDLTGGQISMVTIDSLNLPACDLIVLDTEGTEPLAIDGAMRTIDEFKPVIMMEDRDISRHYGYREGWWKEIKGYKLADRVHRDVILVPE